MSTHFLDNVVDGEQVRARGAAVEGSRALRARRIGLGIMGLGDLMYHLGIRYGSDGSAGIRLAGDGVRALPLHEDLRAVGERSRRVPGH